MDKDLLQDYLLKSGMNQAQSKALSRVFADTATKDDLRTLHDEIRADLRMLESDLRADMRTLEHKIDSKLASLKADLTWRMISSLVLLATIMTLLDVFTG